MWSAHMDVESPPAKKTRAREAREQPEAFKASRRKRYPEWLELGCEVEYCEWSGEFRSSWCSGEVVEHTDEPGGVRVRLQSRVRCADAPSPAPLPEATTVRPRRPQVRQVGLHARRAARPAACCAAQRGEAAAATAPARLPGQPARRPAAPSAASRRVVGRATARPPRRDPRERRARAALPRRVRQLRRHRRRGGRCRSAPGVALGRLPLERDAAHGEREPRTCASPRPS